MILDYIVIQVESYDDIINVYCDKCKRSIGEFNTAVGFKKLTVEVVDPHLKEFHSK